MTVRTTLGPGGIRLVTIDTNDGPTSYELPPEAAGKWPYKVRHSKGAAPATVTVAAGGYIDDVLNATKTIGIDGELTFEGVPPNTWQSYGSTGGSGGGSNRLAVITATENITPQPWQLVLCDVTAVGNFTVTLPLDGVTEGDQIAVKLNATTAGGLLQVVRGAADTGIFLQMAQEAVAFVYDGEGFWNSFVGRQATFALDARYASAADSRLTDPRPPVAGSVTLDKLAPDVLATLSAGGGETVEHVETNVPLGAGDTWIGDPHDMVIGGATGTLSAEAESDQAFTLTVEGSADGRTGWATVTGGSEVAVLGGGKYAADLAPAATPRYQRVKVVAGGTAMTTLAVTSEVSTQLGIVADDIVDDAVTETKLAPTVRAVALAAEPLSPLARRMASFTALSPAVTFTAINSTTSTLTNPRNVSATAAGAPFRYGSDTGVNAPYVTPLGPTVTAGVARAVSNDEPMHVAFDFDGQAFEIDHNNSAAHILRVWANEQVSLDYGPSGNTSRKLSKVDFGSAAYRRIVIEFDKGAAFAGINVAGTDSVTPPTAQTTLRIAGLGDSYMAGLYNLAGSSYFIHMARALGFANVRRYAVSGTGFATVGTSAYPVRTTEVIAAAPDYLLVQGSINDRPYAATTLQTKATEVLTALRTGLPNTRILVTGPLNVNVANLGIDTPIHTALVAACTAVGLPYLDTLNAGWFAGTGTTAAPTGVGNADKYNTSGHPSPAGAYYLGQQMARLVSTAWGIHL